MSPRVLVVDDEPQLRRTLERALHSFGYDAVAVGDADEAYEMLGGSEFDLVLLDLRLPGVSGETLFLAVVRRWPRMAGRIVLMSGDPYSAAADWPEEMRAAPLLAKPFTLETLQRTVAGVLARVEEELEDDQGGPLRQNGRG